RTIVIERYLDDMGDWRVCILSHFGARVHAPWAMAIGAMVRERSGDEPDILWTNDGIVVRFPGTDQPPPVELLLPDPDTVSERVQASLAVGGGGARAANLGAPTTALFAARFRENAARALLLPRRRPGQRAPLWQQRKRAGDLLAVASRYEGFPIVLETYREVLQDVFDMPGLVELLAAIRSRRIRIVTVDTKRPSPFAASLLFNYVANFMYEGDAPLAELRAQALTVDPAQLRALLGEDVSRRFSVAPTPVHDALRRLAEAGTIVEGQFRPGATATEWCDAGVLRTLRGRSLARLRREVEPVEQEAFARFAVAWHGIEA